MITFISRSNNEDIDKLHRDFLILRWTINIIGLNKRKIEYYNDVIDGGIPEVSTLFFKEFRTSLKRIQKMLEDDNFIKVVNKYKPIVNLHQLIFALIVDMDYYLYSFERKVQNEDLTFSEKRLNQTKHSLKLIFENINTLNQDMRAQSGKIKKLIFKITKTNLFFKTGL